MSINTVGVIGAGVIGTGVAQDLAQTGHEVILVDLSADILESAKNSIRNGIRAQRLMAKGGNGESVETIMGRLHMTTDPVMLKEANLVIENVTEKWSIKKEVYQRIDSICADDCIFAANTSAIPITRIASVTKRPALIIGIHFMNPVPMKSMVEVIRGYHTSERTLNSVRSLLARLHKECVVVSDGPGFVANRVLMLTINEAAYVLQDQIATAEEVDTIFKGCFGHQMGPLETADLIGLDTVLNSIDVLYESFSDSKYRPCPLLRKMVEAGLYGRKNGEGFYSY